MDSNDNIFEHIEHAIQHDVETIETWVSDTFNHHDALHDAPADPALTDANPAPVAATDAAIIGTPDADAAYWHHQEAPRSCAIAAQSFVIEQLTGQTVDENQLAQTAATDGVYTVDGGTPPEDCDAMLKQADLQTTNLPNQTYDDLERALSAGHGVIVGVNEEQIYTAVFPIQSLINDVHTIPGQGADHAVEVTGIDRRDPNNPVVILNDPAGTAAERVPLDVFMTAWNTSGNRMIEAWKAA